MRAVLLFFLLLLLLSVGVARAQEQKCEYTPEPPNRWQDVQEAEQNYKREQNAGIRVVLDLIRGLKASGESLQTKPVRDFLARVLTLTATGNLDLDYTEFAELGIEAFGSSEKLIDAMQAELMALE